MKNFYWIPMWCILFGMTLSCRQNSESSNSATNNASGDYHIETFAFRNSDIDCRDFQFTISMVKNGISSTRNAYIAILESGFTCDHHMVPTLTRNVYYGLAKRGVDSCGGKKYVSISKNEGGGVTELNVTDYRDISTTSSGSLTDECSSTLAQFLMKINVRNEKPDGEREKEYVIPVSTI